MSQCLVQTTGVPHPMPVGTGRTVQLPGLLDTAHPVHQNIGDVFFRNGVSGFARTGEYNSARAIEAMSALYQATEISGQQQRQRQQQSRGRNAQSKARRYISRGDYYDMGGDFQVIDFAVVNSARHASKRESTFLTPRRLAETSPRQRSKTPRPTSTSALPSLCEGLSDRNSPFVAKRLSEP